MATITLDTESHSDIELMRSIIAKADAHLNGGTATLTTSEMEAAVIDVLRRIGPNKRRFLYAILDGAGDSITTLAAPLNLSTQSVHSLRNGLGRSEKQTRKTYRQFPGLIKSSYLEGREGKVFTITPEVRSAIKKHRHNFPA